MAEVVELDFYETLIQIFEKSHILIDYRPQLLIYWFDLLRVLQQGQHPTKETNGFDFVLHHTQGCDDILHGHHVPPVSQSVSHVSQSANQSVSQQVR